MVTHAHILVMLFAGTLLSLTACGGDDTTDESDLPTLTSTCVAENDCDDDGLYTSCDDDDSDAANVTIKDGCDEDLDGFVDTYCTAYDNERDVNDDGLITADERDVNCDTCPPGDPTQSYNPDQADTDQDGIGDDCSVDANINIGAAYDAEAIDNSETADATDTTADDQTTGNSDDAAETYDITVSGTSNDTTATLAKAWTVNFDVTNNSDVEALSVEVLLKKRDSFDATALAAVITPETPDKLTVAPTIFCGDSDASCVTLGPKNITAAAGTTTSFSINFSMPNDLHEGKYTGQIRLIVTDEDGSGRVVARDWLSSKVEVSAGVPDLAIVPAVSIDSGLDRDIRP